MSRFTFSLRRLFGHRSADAALDDEIRFHLEMSIEQKVAGGMDPEAARREALRDFGGVEQFKEKTRESWGLRLLFDTLRDVRFAFRQMGRRKGYSAVVILTLALCLGANTTAFSLLHNLILKPYTYPGVDEVYRIGVQETARGSGMVGSVSVPEYLFIAEHITAFSALGMAESYLQADLEAEGGVERISLDRVTPGVWEALGVTPLRGRTFDERDVAQFQDRVVVLSYALYRRMQAAGREVLGDDITIDGQKHRVIGVMPEGFYLGFMHAALWTPRLFRGDEHPGDHSFDILARIAPGVSREQAVLELTQLRSDYLDQNPDQRDWYERTGSVFGLVQVNQWLNQVMPMMSVAFLSIQAVTAIVLFIGCLNISGMIMVRSSARMRELCMRRALGAGKGRLARQLITEIMVLFFFGGLASLVVVKLGYAGVTLLDIDQVPWGQALTLSPVVLFATFAVAFLAALLTGGLPLLGILRGRLYQLLQADGRTQSGSRQSHRLHTAFVVGQVAFSVILLILAGVSVGNMLGVLKRDPGFERAGRVSLLIYHPEYRFGTGEEAYRERIQPLRERVLEALRATPGVIAAGASNRIPGSPYDTGHSNFEFVHYVLGENEQRPVALRQNISPGYFATVQTQILMGRDFNAGDTWESDHVVIVNKALIDRYFEGLDPIGMKLKFWGQEVTIVGVVEEVQDKAYFLEESDYTLYLPISQWTMYAHATRFIVHLEGDIDAARDRLRAVIHRCDPEAAVEIETFEDTYQIATFTYRLPMALTVTFALVAIFLTALGLYGLISYAVTERTKEFGIRMALGAPVGSIGRMVAHWSAVKVGCGLVLGLGVAYLICWKVKPIVSDFDPTSALPFVLAFVLIAVVAFLASYFPTRRATRISPAAALRYQ